MVEIRVKYVVEDVDRHGNVRLYLRRRGQPKVRLPEPLGSVAFWEAYRNAIAGATLTKPIKTPRPKTDSFRWLCEGYYLSAEFKQLSDRTRLVRRRILDKYCLEHGDKPFGLMEPRHIRAQRDAISETPEAANQLVKLLRQVLAYAVTCGHLRHNPAKEVPYIQSLSQGFHTWSVEEVHKFEAAHSIGTTARLAMALLLYTGQRRSDVVRFGRQHVKDGSLQFTQEKGKSRRPITLTIPVLPALKEIIDVTKTGQMVFLATQTGKAFTSNGFGNRFRKWCDAAGLPHCSAHGLRKAGATIAANNGATSHELMAIFGWKTLKQVQRYTAAANQMKLAAGAMHLLIPEQAVNETVPLSEPVRASGTKPSPK